MKKYFLVAFFLVAFFVAWMLIPVSSQRKNTLNPVSLWVYSLKAEAGDASALTPLCYHYVFGEKKNREKAIYWVDKLSEYSKKTEQRIEVFEMGILDIGGRDHEESRSSLGD